MIGYNVVERKVLYMKKENKLIVVVLVCLLITGICGTLSILNIAKLHNRNKKLKTEKEEIKKELEIRETEAADLSVKLTASKEEIESLNAEVKKLSTLLIEKEKKNEEEKVESPQSSEVEESTENFYYEESLEPEYEESIYESEEIHEESPEASSDIPWIMYEVVEAEVRGASKEDKMHVAHVIMNRVNSDSFPNNIYDVCLSPNQFATRGDVDQSTIDAVNEAMNSADTTDGALFFHSGEYSDEFCGADYIFTDDAGHHFYK